MNNKKFLNSHRITTISLLTAASLIVFVIENFFPPLILPGAKIGLANVFTLIAIVLFSPVEACIITIVRCLLGNLIVGNFSALMYSLPAGLISTIVSSILITYCINKISILCVSIVSAVIHNIVQNLIFCAVTSTKELFIYTPYLALLGALSGLIVGILSFFIIKYIPRSIYEKSLGIKENNNSEDK